MRGMRPVSPSPLLSRPALLLPLAYAAAVAVTGGLLATLPTVAGGGGLGWVEALFTATSAVTLTGLTVVDTAALTRVGQGVLFGALLVGTLGMVTVGVAAVSLFTRARSHSQVALGADLASSGPRHTRRLATTVVVAVTAGLVVGTPSLRAAGIGWFDAAFLALSGFSNAGFTTLAGDLAAVRGSVVAPVVVMVLVLVGGVGYPVLLDVADRVRGRTRRLGVTAWIMLAGSVVLLVVGAVVVGAVEWSRPETLGAATGVGERARWLATLTVMPRSAGFSVVEMPDLHPVSQLVTVMLMFIGAGPAATGGGIKVTGAVVLLWAAVASMRARTEVTTSRWRLDPPVVFQAVATALALTVAAAMLTVVVLLDDPTVVASHAVFDAVSAATTTGLATGVVAAGGDGVHLVASVAMFAGRVVPMLLALQLATASAPSVRPAAVRPLVT